MNSSLLPNPMGGWKQYSLALRVVGRTLSSFVFWPFAVFDSASDLDVCCFNVGSATKMSGTFGTWWDGENEEAK